MVARSLSAYYAPAYDDDDDAIVGEAAYAQLALRAKRETSRAAEGRSARNAWAFVSGFHGVERTRIYEVAARDGLAWTYFQPYSGLAQLPGEHHFILRGSLPAPVEVIPPALEWRKPSFVMGVLITCSFFTLLYGVGLLLLAFLFLIFPARYRFKSADPRLARWFGKHPSVRAVMRTTRFGWLRSLGGGGWRLPWVIQIHSLGNGTTLLVCKAPDVGRLGFQRWRVGFAQAAHLARAVQSVLGPWAHPAQTPLHAPAFM